MEDIAEIVSDDTHDKTANESISPGSVNRHTAARLGGMIALGAGWRVWVRVVGICLPLSTRDMNIEMACGFAVK
jgi:hypothetical protein